MATARAAVCLAVWMFLLALPPVVEPTAPCTNPRSAGDRAGRTLRVECADAPDGAPLRGPAKLLFDQPLDPNHETAETLQVLPGIGPGRAAAILAARQARPFDRVADLERAHGIGPKTVHAIAPYLRVEPGRRSADSLGEGPDSPVGSRAWNTARQDFSGER